MSESIVLPESERIEYSRMQDSDLDELAQLLGDPTTMQFYPRSRTRDEALDWISWNQRNYARDGLGLWTLRLKDPASDTVNSARLAALKENSKSRAASSYFIGDCGLTWQRIDGDEDLEIGYHVRPELQGQGLATEAAQASRDLAISLGHRRLISIIHPDNIASRRVAEKVGMQVDRETVSRTGIPVVVYAGEW
ncbi:GNAT family N-acetyltransferase [Neomicrococcus lactis]|uniref:RimJ/RimL family protein N-acetyltransferase n=1 Tax=Neomicrococcus lactis TaxID=732241 RepID=A0A7W9DBD6_9MICC|nr:GNAT family N-acetyltransferase [Neomicrococcus lactis]MBB5597772.1 RimJ/RimL family protein N-acetyltransferase [Neomicrococcus lactis]